MSLLILILYAFCFLLFFLFVFYPFFIFIAIAPFVNEGPDISSQNTILSISYLLNENFKTKFPL